MACVIYFVWCLISAGLAFLVVWLIAWSMGLLASWFLVGFLKMVVVSWFGLVTVGGGCFALVVLVIVDWCLWIS